jgi:hypothetical protein
MNRTTERLRIAVTVSVLMLALVNGGARAADENPLEGLKLTGEAYIDWSRYDIQDATSNEFSLKRGYVTVTKKANSWLSFRYTLDVKQASTSTTVTQEEGDEPITVKPANALDGNYVFRTKYLFAEMLLGDAGFLSDVRARLGMQHVGPDDFEQSMNPYRAQDRNWLERAGLFGTADLGVGLNGAFGGKLDDAKGKTGSAKYDGRLGSFQLALTNGSGYDKAEKNENKLASGRISVRPAAATVPGLQLTAAGVFGKDNTLDGPDAVGVDFNFLMGMISWQSPQVTVYGQYFTSENSQAGVFGTGSGADRTGLRGQSWSAFASVRLPDAGSRWALFGRASFTDPDADDDVTTSDQETGVSVMTGGVSCDLAKGNMFIAAFDNTSYDPYANELGKAPTTTRRDRKDDQRIQLVYKLEF